MEDNTKVTYIDKLKSIYDKDVAINNAIIQGDYDKFKAVADKSPDFVSEKHLRVYEAAANKIAEPQRSMYAAIETDLKHISDLKYSQYWTKQNGLDLSDFKGVNSNQLLREYLSNDRPSFKEPIITYIKNDINNIKELTAEKLDRKLNDLTLNNFGGRKISEADKLAVIEFAKVEAIKNNRLDLYQHLDKEFKIVGETLHTGRSITADMKYIKANAGLESPILKYYDDTARKIYNEEKFDINRGETKINSSFVSQQKLNVVEQSEKLITAIEKKDLAGIKEHIMNGADEKLVSKEKLKQFDPRDQMEIFTAAKEAIQKRNDLLPESAKYGINEMKNFELKAAFLSQDATRVYTAIKNGADPKALKDISIDHIPQNSVKDLQAAVVNAVNENSKSHTQEKGPNNGIS